MTNWWLELPETKLGGQRKLGVRVFPENKTGVGERTMVFGVNRRVGELKGTVVSVSYRRFCDEK